MKLFSTLLGTALGASVTPQSSVDIQAALGADIIYTPYQIEKLEENGIDTTNYPVDLSLSEVSIEKGVGTDVPWRAVWQNPEGYSGSGLIIPYRFQKQGAFSTTQEKDIEAWLDELSGYLDGCVSFVNDTNDKKYSKDYIYIRNIDDNGNRLKGVCNSYIGNITKFYKMNSQDLNLSVTQPDYRSHCIFKKTVQHEMMHALGQGFFHEQSRPDRDNYIDVHLENVEPANQFNFDKMKTEEWIDTGDVYDLKSAMHYDGDAFLTKEAYEKGLSSMTYKGTNERVVVNAARATSIDVVQISERYHKFCERPKTRFCPAPAWNGEYYLEGRDCDGVVDCSDKSDEQPSVCQDYNCGKKMYLTSQTVFGGTLTFDFVNGDYINEAPYWYNTQRRWYLYQKRPGTWYIHQRAGNDAAYYYGIGDEPCPTGRNDEWYYPVNGQWASIPDFSIRGE